MAHGTPDEAAQHVPTILVGGEDPVADEEGHRPSVLGEDAQRRVASRVPAQGHAGHPLRGLDQGCEHIGLVDRVDALHHAEDAFESRSGVDVLPGKLHIDPVGSPVELHEDEVPDLQKSLVAAVQWTAGLAIAITLVHVDLRARTARSRGTARRAPPVVLAHPLDPRRVDAHHITPDRRCLVVTCVTRDPQDVGVEPEDLGDQTPRHGDGLGLEVITEAEVPEHLEEAEMTSGPTHLVEVVLLATRSDALLHRRDPRVRRLLVAEEIGLERDHAGDREQQIGIMGNQARGRNDHVATITEVRGEGSPEVIGIHGSHSLTVVGRHP